MRTGAPPRPGAPGSFPLPQLGSVSAAIVPPTRPAALLLCPPFALQRVRCPPPAGLVRAGLPCRRRCWHGPCGAVRRGNMAVSGSGPGLRPGAPAVLLLFSCCVPGAPSLPRAPHRPLGSLFAAAVSGNRVPRRRAGGLCPGAAAPCCKALRSVLVLMGKN